MATTIVPPTQAELKRLLSYDQESGVFTRRIGFGSVKAGQTAGTRTQKGYLRIKIGSFPYPAHRLAWLYVHNEWPVVVDHIDGDKANNRIANLRPATVSQNCWNQKTRVTNTSGFKGVSFNPSAKGRPWMASIGAFGRRKTLGRFATKEEAYAAYCAAAHTTHGKFARVA